MLVGLDEEDEKKGVLVVARDDHRRSTQAFLDVFNRDKVWNRIFVSNDAKTDAQKPNRKFLEEYITSSAFRKEQRHSKEHKNRMHQILQNPLMVVLETEDDDMKTIVTRFFARWPTVERIVIRNGSDT
jgi:hypothetical protein